MFHRIFDEGLAHSSYVVACDRTRQAAIVDPRRDVDVYVELAAQRGLTITHAVDTHIHADFVSGARELGAAGARVIAGPGADLAFASEEVHDGDVLAIGDVPLRILHTPGHTPEHISLLFREGETDHVLTGDTLFVGAVGRPDLLGEERSRELARQLHASLMDTLLALPDAVQVHPAHGAGSLCGTAIGSEPHSTIGQERRNNPMLQHRSR
ncbi:MAG TPA: MBL fold metallo-hydrolase, partial [Solirubrobacteraceae bacterium]|nr:MBL fold metallo-hydrolase [Solirubrobacteraceae bacterium]